MMDPLTGAVCTPDEIKQMVDEMLVACEEWLPQYAEEIKEAKERLKDKTVPYREGIQAAGLRPSEQKCRYSQHSKALQPRIRPAGSSLRIPDVVQKTSGRNGTVD